MSKNSNKNRNYQRIDKLIVDSFIKLSKEEESKNVSVSHVCEIANINRTTFYNHYKDIWEIIEVIENGIIEKVSDILKDVSYGTFIKNPYETLSKLNLIILEDPDYYKRLYELSESRFFLDKMKVIFRKKILSNTDLSSSLSKGEDPEVVVSFFVGGIANLYSDWFEKRLPLSLDKMTMALSESLKKIGRTTF